LPLLRVSTIHSSCWGQRQTILTSGPVGSNGKVTSVPFTGFFVSVDDGATPYWSHYADRHRGVCLGFEVPDELLAAVRYRAKRYDADLARLWGGGAEAQAEMLKVLTTKYSHWRYESELRSFVRLDEQDSESGLYFIPFSERPSLRIVIVGHASDVTRDEIRETLGDIVKDVDAIKARLAFKSFTVVRQRKPNLRE